MSTQNERSVKSQLIWNSTNSNSVTPTMVGSLLYDINVEKLERDNSNAVYQTYDTSYTKVAAINPTTKKMTLIDIPSGVGDLSNYYTKTEVDTNLATKLDKPSTDGTFLVKKVGGTISYEAFSGGSATKTTFTHDILVANWTLVSGKYEAVISNVGILADSFVDIIPSNDNLEIVRNAQIFPSVLVSVGSVKVYSKFLPSGTISVTVNII